MEPQDLIPHTPLVAPVPVTAQSWPENVRPLVSVCCMTYQQVNFIRDAIEGFLMQETTFPVEIIIHDDASTDGTAEIVQAYAERFPNVIRTLLQKENQYSQGNKPSKILRGMCHGEFIAFCEGDDYWIDSTKIQQQANHLQANSDCAVVFHNSYILKSGDDDKNELDVFAICSKNAVFTTRDLIVRNWFTPTASLMYRTEHAIRIPPNIKYFSGDLYLLLNLSLHGDLHYINKTMSVYRKHAGGISHKLNDTGEFARWVGEFIGMLDDFAKSNNLNYDLEINSRALDLIGDRIRDIAMKSALDGNVPMSRTKKNIDHVLKSCIECTTRIHKHVLFRSAYLITHWEFYCVGHHKLINGCHRDAIKYYIKSLAFRPFHMRTYYHALKSLHLSFSVKNLARS